MSEFVESKKRGAGFAKTGRNIRKKRAKRRDFLPFAAKKGGRPQKSFRARSENFFIKIGKTASKTA